MSILSLVKLSLFMTGEYIYPIISYLASQIIIYCSQKRLAGAYILENMTA